MEKAARLLLPPVRGGATVPGSHKAATVRSRLPGGRRWTAHYRIIAKIPDSGLQKTARADILRLRHETVLPLLPENPDSVWKIERGALLRALES